MVEGNENNLLIHMFERIFPLFLVSQKNGKSTVVGLPVDRHDY